METIEIGSTPHGEDCAQVGADNYQERARIECRSFKAQLERVAVKWMNDNHGTTNLPEGFRLTIKSFPHDFGSYYEVCAKFDENDELAVELAYYLEGEGPEFWDDIAKAEVFQVKWNGTLEAAGVACQGA